MLDEVLQFFLPRDLLAWTRFTVFQPPYAEIYFAIACAKSERKGPVGLKSVLRVLGQVGKFSANYLPKKFGEQLLICSLQNFVYVSP